MSALREYLEQKRGLLAAMPAPQDAPDPPPISASVTVEGRSGVRRIRIRDHQIINDSGPGMAGYDLGPTSPEIALGILGACMAHIYLIQAAEQGVELDAVDVEVTGKLDLRAGAPGFEEVPAAPHDIAYTLRLESPATPEQIRALHEAVERTCPIYNLFVRPQAIAGTVLLNERPVEGIG